MKLAVTGATGALGAHAVPRLVESGHRIRALVRPTSNTRELDALGIEFVRGDVLDGAAASELVAGCDAVLHLATAVPRPGTPRDFRENDRIRREGTSNLLAACAAHGTTRFVLQSIAMLYRSPGGEWCDATTQVTPSAVSQSAADAEEQVRARSPRPCILRCGLFYGARTGMDDHWRRQARERRLAAPAEDAYVSLVHVADAAAAFVSAVDTERTGVFDIVDDEPVRWTTLYDHIAALEEAPPPPRTGPAPLPSFRVRNALARRELEWRPRFATFRAGLVAGDSKRPERRITVAG